MTDLTIHDYLHDILGLRDYTSASDLRIAYDAYGVGYRRYCKKHGYAAEWVGR